MLYISYVIYIYIYRYIRDIYTTPSNISIIDENVNEG